MDNHHTVIGLKPVTVNSQNHRQVGKRRCRRYIRPQLSHSLQAETLFSPDDDLTSTARRSLASL